VENSQNVSVNQQVLYHVADGGATDWRLDPSK